MSVTLRRKPKPKGQTGRVLMLGRNHGRPPTKTGTPDWFGEMRLATIERKFLSRLPVGELHRKGLLTFKQTESLKGSGFASVYSVVNADYRDLEAVPGFARKTLAKLRQDAKIKLQINMKWSVPS